MVVNNHGILYLLYNKKDVIFTTNKNLKTLNGKSQNIGLTNQTIPDNLPDSLHAIVALPLSLSVKYLKLEDIKLVRSHEDAFKYIYRIKEYQLLDPAQCFDYYSFDDENHFWNFLSTYLNEDNIDYNKELPKKLVDTFWVYKSRARALNKKTELIKKQDTYYEGLLDVAKPHVDKQQIQVVDLNELIIDYIRRIILPNMVNDPEFIKQFKANEENFKKSKNKK